MNNHRRHIVFTTLFVHSIMNQLLANAIQVEFALRINAVRTRLASVRLLVLLHRPQSLTNELHGRIFVQNCPQPVACL